MGADSTDESRLVDAVAPNGCLLEIAGGSREPRRTIMIEIQTIQGQTMAPHLNKVAALRIQVFREYPYLYDGSTDYELEYLAAYSQSASSVLVLAIDRGQVVGASTGMALLDADAEFQKPFLNSPDVPAKRIFYLGESVLAREYRGRGIGKRFFDEREFHAQRLGFEITAFCAVKRPADHPLRPADYRPLDSFWQSRGYRRCPDRTASLSWKQIDAAAEMTNELEFWLKGHRAAAASLNL